MKKSLPPAPEDSRITALPPLSEVPKDGKSYYVCNPYEWAAATLHKGDSCFFRKKTWKEWRRGTFILSWMYDGIIADVYEDDPDDFIKHGLFLDLGDKLIRVEDRELLAQWEALPR